VYRIHKEELCDLLRSPHTVKKVNCQKVTMGLGYCQDGEKKECIPNAGRKFSWKCLYRTKW
jgi:hypothetical protein